MKILYPLSLAVIALIVGCGPRVDREELGTIVNKPPEFDRYDAAYPLPQLETTPAGTNEAKPANAAAEPE